MTVEELRAMFTPAELHEFIAGWEPDEEILSRMMAAAKPLSLQEMFVMARCCLVILGSGDLTTIEASQQYRDSARVTDDLNAVLAAHDISPRESLMVAWGMVKSVQDRFIAALIDAAGGATDGLAGLGRAVPEGNPGGGGSMGSGRAPKSS